MAVYLVNKYLCPYSIRILNFICRKGLGTKDFLILLVFSLISLMNSAAIILAIG